MKLPDVFYTMPECANTTMTGKDLRALLLQSSGWVMSCGYNWDIKSELLAVDVYRVTLKRRVYD